MVSDTGFEPAPSWPQTRWTSCYPNPRKIWWTVTGSNRSFRLAKPVCPQQHLQPIFFKRTVSNACIEEHSLRHLSPGQLYALRYARFFHTLQEVLLIPEDALICSLECCRLALPCTKRKTPGFLVPGSFCILFEIRLLESSHLQRTQDNLEYYSQM